MIKISGLHQDTIVSTSLIFHSHGSGGSHGSLVLCGFDPASRQGDVYIFQFSNDTTDRFLGLEILSISAKNTTISSKNSSMPFELLSSRVWAAIDTSLPFLELPEIACRAMQRAFGLQYNHALDIFQVTPTARARLREQNPNITISVGIRNETHMTHDYIFPYAAFDHEIQLCNGSKIPYFPIRVAKSDSGNILGRVFLQEA